jgi:hypothetical protein
MAQPKMAESSISLLQEIHEAIATDNPFVRPPVVTDQDVWGDPFPDLKNLNRHGSDTVLELLAGSPHYPRLTSITITGDRGTGKSHLISRIRHQLPKDPGSLFIYTPLGQYTDANLLRYQFQQTIVNSLRHQGSQGVMQWRQLAAKIANQALKEINPDARLFHPLELVKNLQVNNLAKNQSWINQLTEGFFRIKPDIGEPDILRAIIWTLCNAQAPYALKWLAGNVLTEEKAAQLGLPNHSEEYRDSNAWEMVMQILTLISDYYGVIICFDKLESRDNGAAGLKRERIVASLVKRLFDTIERSRLNYPLIILTVMTAETWENKVLNLPPGIPSYLSDIGDPIELRQITNDEIVQLIALWLQNFYQAYNLTPPTSVYPFDADQLKALGREQLTVRQILEWCADNVQSVKVDPEQQVERLFVRANSLGKEGLSEAELDRTLQDHSLLADLLEFALQAIQGESIAGVTVESVSRLVTAKKTDQGYIQLRAIASDHESDQEQAIKIGIAIAQQQHPQSLCATLKRLVQYEKFDLTRGCLLRSGDRDIPEHWQAYRYLQQLCSEMGGQWIHLCAADVKPLLAIWQVYRQRSEYGLSAQQIYQFARSQQLIAKNPLIRAILIDVTPAISSNSHHHLANDPLTPESPLTELDLAPIDLPEFGF